VPSVLIHCTETGPHPARSSLGYADPLDRRSRRSGLLADQEQSGSSKPAKLVRGPDKSVYARLGVTESNVNTNFPELRCEIGLRSWQYREEQAKARRDAVSAEIQENVRSLHAEEICPSLPRVTRLSKDGFLREGRVAGKAINDARRELVDRLADAPDRGNGAKPTAVSGRDRVSQ
jgi:hypothetical protein